MTTPSGEDATSDRPPAGGPPPGAEFLGGTVLAPDGPQRKSRRTALLAGGAAAVVMFGAAGAAAVVLGDRLGGGGTRPADRLPAGAMLYAEIDVDPGAGQKLGAVRFIRKFPELREKFEEDRDSRRSVWNLISENDEDLRRVDYAEDIEPWLGERVGFAVLPRSGGGLDEEDVVAALEVTDEDRALAGINRLNELDGGGDDLFAAPLDGYLVLGTSQAVVDKAARDADEASLADQATFKADVDGLGERGLVSGWADLEALGGSAPGDGATGGTPGTADAMRSVYQGRYAFSVRFDGDDLEVVADGLGVPGTDAYASEADLRLVTALPDSTSVALGIAEGESLVRDGWSQVKEQLRSIPFPAPGMGLGGVQDSLREFESRTGIRLPDDLGVLLGEDFALGFEPAADGLPKVGAVARTDGAKAESVLRKMLDAVAQQGVQLPVTVERTADGYVAASTQGYADALAAGGRLGDSDGFRSALPDVADANVALYADVDRLVGSPGVPSMSEQDRQTWTAFDAVGLTVSREGESIRMRLKVVTR